jgi:hypothetical protein
MRLHPGQKKNQYDSASPSIDIYIDSASGHKRERELVLRSIDDDSRSRDSCAERGTSKYGCV